MFKRVINTEGFWKSVFSLAVAFALLFTLAKWALSKFSMEYFSQISIGYLAVLLLAGCVYGFFVTFGKYRRQLKENDSKR